MGNERAFARLYELTGGRLLAIARGIVGRADRRRGRAAGLVPARLALGASLRPWQGRGLWLAGPSGTQPRAHGQGGAAAARRRAASRSMPRRWRRRARSRGPGDAQRGGAAGQCLSRQPAGQSPAFGHAGLFRRTDAQRAGAAARRAARHRQELGAARSRGDEPLPDRQPMRAGASWSPPNMRSAACTARCAAASSAAANATPVTAGPSISGRIAWRC